jgi:CHAT domain-containing protein
LSRDQPAVLALAAAQRWLQTRTAGEVCAFAARARLQLADGDPVAARLALAEAQIRLSAGDLQGAVTAAETAVSAATNDARSAAEDVRDVARFLQPASRPPNLARKVYAHPFFWAPFVLIGDWR